ncbi:MAG: hypothetical protein SPM31_00585 [Prevotella sp.]|nr:hypothetical protein [Prevotella sp.]
MKPTAQSRVSCIRQDDPSQWPPQQPDTSPKLLRTKFLRSPRRRKRSHAR